MRCSRFTTPVITIGTLCLLAALGCSSNDTTTTNNVGGSSSNGTGGSANNAGATSTAAGKSSTGGSSTTPASTGGAPTVGGSSSSAPASTGGAPTVGGSSSSAPASTGGAPTVGGSSSTTPASTGGAPTVGGGSNVAGTSSVAGAKATGGSQTNAGSSSVNPTGGAGGAAGGANGTGGSTSVANVTLDDLIGAICDWEFKCCDSGEAKWELGPIVTTSAACKEKFVYLLRSDNSAQSPYPSNGSAAINGLLIQLAYQVDMTKVTENPTGIAQCIAQWKAMSCTTAPDPKAATTHCTGTTAGYVNPCDLTNLVNPTLKAGDICNFTLTEGAYNDVECVAGTTCLDKTNPDNSNKNYPTCVTRGVANAPCTLDKDCDFNFYCNASGHCIAKGSSGDTCAYKTAAAPVPGQMDMPCKPGLACNPTTLTCVNNCTNGYVCNSSATDAGNDYICPSGSSCIPVTVGNDSTSFKVCSATGTTAGAKCNSLEDCGSGLYCASTVCATRVGLGQPCATTTAGNCDTGMFCKTNVCATYVGNGQACTQATTGVADIECDPTNGAIGCVYKYDTVNAKAGYICSNALLANDQRCGQDFDCVSNHCEFATLAATYRTCIAGAAAGASCDATQDNGQYTRCAAGLTCRAGQCVAQVGPGGNCESTSTAGTADSTLCEAGVCDATQWTSVGPGNIMCTDAPVPVLNGGTGLTCDGKP